MPADNTARLDATVHLLRHVSGTLHDGEVVDGAAFKPRADHDGELSVNQLGLLSKDPEEDLTCVRQIMSKWITIRASGRLAEVCASDLIECAAEYEATFGFFSDPRSEEGKPDDPTHALICGIPLGDDDTAIALRDMIAMKVTALHPGIVRSA